MRLIKAYNDLKIFYDGKKYNVSYNDQILLTYYNGEPTFVDENLVIVDEDIINIYQNIRQGLISTSIICKQGIVIAKPILFKESVIVVFRNGIVQFDTNLNILKKVNCEFDGSISQERVVDNKYFVFTINSEDKLMDVIYDIENNSIIKEKEKCGIMLVRS